MVSQLQCLSLGVVMFCWKRLKLGGTLLLSLFLCPSAFGEEKVIFKDGKYVDEYDDWMKPKTQKNGTKYYELEGKTIIFRIKGKKYSYKIGKFLGGGGLNRIYRLEAYNGKACNLAIRLPAFKEYFSPIEDFPLATKILKQNGQLVPRSHLRKSPFPYALVVDYMPVEKDASGNEITAERFLNDKIDWGNLPEEKIRQKEAELERKLIQRFSKTWKLRTIGDIGWHQILLVNGDWAILDALSNSKPIKDFGSETEFAFKNSSRAGGAQADWFEDAIKEETTDKAKARIRRIAQQMEANILQRRTEHFRWQNTLRGRLRNRIQYGCSLLGAKIKVGAGKLGSFLSGGS